MRSDQPRRLRWVLILSAFIASLSIGCSPASISMLFMPFNDNKLDPEYKLFAAGKELKLVILSNFARYEFREDQLNAEKELADRVAEYFRKRCGENKHKIKIVPRVDVGNFAIDEAVGGEELALAAGRKFKADFVLDLEIKSFELYQKKAYPKMFLGNTEIVVSLYKMDGTGDGYRVFNKELRTEYPSSGPIMADNGKASSFRASLLTKVAREITKLMIAFPPEERMAMD